MKTPAFQFYPGDFLSSPDVQMMTTQEIGAYCLLLFNAWIITDKPGFLPNNQKKLQRLTRLNEKEWGKAKDIILEKFSVSECGSFLYNKRLIAEFDKQEIRRLRLAANGSKGGRPPRQDEKPIGFVEEPKNNQQVNFSKPDDKQEERLSFSSSISFPSSLNEEDKSSSLDAGVPPTPEGAKKESKFLNLFNLITGRGFRGLSEKTERNFKKLIKKEFTNEQFKSAILNGFIDSKTWAKPELYTPEYISREDNFLKYLNWGGSKPTNPSSEKERMKASVERNKARL